MENQRGAKPLFSVSDEDCRPFRGKIDDRVINHFLVNVWDPVVHYEIRAVRKLSLSAWKRRWRRMKQLLILSSFFTSVSSCPFFLVAPFNSPIRCVCFGVNRGHFRPSFWNPSWEWSGHFGNEMVGLPVVNVLVCCLVPKWSRFYACLSSWSKDILASEMINGSWRRWWRVCVVFCYASWGISVEGEKVNWQVLPISVILKWRRMKRVQYFKSKASLKSAKWDNAMQG